MWGEGDDDVALFEEVDREQEQRDLAAAKAWRAKRYDAGLGWITGAEGVRRPRAARRLRPRSTPASRRKYEMPEPELLRHRPRHGRPDDPGPRPPTT